jgi:hypothetical protein
VNSGKVTFMNSTLSGGRQNTVHFCLLVLTGEGTAELRTPNLNHMHQRGLGHLGRDQFGFCE